MRKLRFRKSLQGHGKRAIISDDGLSFDDVDIADDVFGQDASLQDYSHGLRRLDDAGFTALATLR